MKTERVWHRDILPSCFFLNNTKANTALSITWMNLQRMCFLIASKWNTAWGNKIVATIAIHIYFISSVFLEWKRASAVFGKTYIFDYQWRRASAVFGSAYIFHFQWRLGMKKRAGTVFESAYIFHFQWCLAMNSGKSSSWQCMYFSFLVASGNEKEQVQFLTVHNISISNGVCVLTYYRIKQVSYIFPFHKT
jgi:hypothetical protein